MLTTKSICALLLTGAAVGSVSTVTVQKQIAPKPVAAKAQGKQGVSQLSRPRVSRPEPAERPASPRILDCPVTGSSRSIAEMPLPDLYRMEIGSAVGEGFPPVTFPTDSGGGGDQWVVIPPDVPGVPAPDTWVMLVAGFGFIGLACRRRKAAA